MRSQALRLLVCLTTVAGLAVGCATTGTGSATVPGDGVESTTPWGIPPSTLDARHLFRLSYRGPEGSGNLKIALFLASPREFTVRVFDRIGRRAWSARSRDGETLWVDHASETFCRTAGPVAWAGLEDLGPLPPRALPALLLQRVPIAPEPSMAVSWNGSRFRFRDRWDRRWDGRVGTTGVLSWTLRENRRPTWWWSRGTQGEGVLSQREEGRQLRWRRVTTEPLDSAPPEIEIPPTYRECPDP